MAQIKNFSQTFEVKATAPLDDRLVVDKVEDLYSISYPYTGMAVTVKGSSDLWVFTGNPGDQKDASKWKKVSGGGLSEYSLPIMTSSMVESALADETSGFTKDTDYIAVDDGTSLDGETENNYVTAANGTYLDIMFSAIRQLQAEVNRLKNSFKYGINSYTEDDTSLSAVSGGDMGSENSDDEPIWAIDPDEVSELTEIKRITEDSLARFSKNTSKNNVYYTESDSQDKITITSDGSTFTLSNSEITSIKSVTDNKLIIYLQVACNKIGDVELSNPEIRIQFKAISDTKNSDSDDDVITLSPFGLMTDIAQVPEYCIMVVVSRKQKNSDDTYSGNNYVYLSVSDRRTDNVLLRGYWNKDNNTITSAINKTIDERYYWDNIYFQDLTITDCRFCSKYQDFSNQVIPKNPDSKNDFKYEAAHITIRSISTKAKAVELKNQLQENELIWVKDEAIMLIKSDGRLRVVTSGSLNEDSDSDNKDIDYMTTQELINKLLKMGIVVTTSSGTDADGDPIFDGLELNKISDITFVNQDTGKNYNFSVDAYGKLQSTEVVEDDLQSLIDKYNIDLNERDYSHYRGLIANIRKGSKGLDVTSDFGDSSDRLRISGFFVPLTSATKCGCSHSFVELENSSTKDIPLEGVILYHKYFNGTNWTFRKLPLDGVCKAGSTYLIRGAQHADIDSPSTFIKVSEYDKEWYEEVDGVNKLVSFEMDNTVTKENYDALNSNIHSFILTFGEIPDLTVDTILIEENTASSTKSNFPILIKNPRYIDGCAYFASTIVNKTGNEETVKQQPYKKDDSWARSYAYPIPLKANTMFRLMFKLDPAKQAFNGFNVKDSSRERYKNKTDAFVVNLDSEKITFKTSPYEYAIEKYTPHASSYNATVMTDKTRLDFDKPNMVNVAFGIDVYKTRCFSWVSVGAFDEYLWIKKQSDSTYTRFESYKDGETISSVATNNMTKKSFNDVLKKAAYDRIVDIFPGDNTPFTAHKCIINFSETISEPTVYEYRVGRGCGFGNNTLDENHCSDVRTFTRYPKTWEGRVYQITDQQGFHWVEYQVWASAAKALLAKIENDNLSSTNEFPIIINTGDMTQSGARINEWLDYHMAGDCLFNHLEQMNVVGNNDLNDINPDVLGTGNDSGKSVSRFFHYFYCHEVPDDESLVMGPDLRYIPSIYYFVTKGIMYLCFNSEMTTTTSQKWLKLNYDDDYANNIITLNPYTGIVVVTNSSANGGATTSNCQNACCDATRMNELHFTPIYKTMYNWLVKNQLNSTPRPVVFACHEIPFTVITVDSLQTLQSQLNSGKGYTNTTRNYPAGSSLLGSHANQMNVNETSGSYWLSRMFEHFGVRLAIGGHKHTYAISWPLQEYYFYSKRTQLNMYLQYNSSSNTYSFVSSVDASYSNRILDVTVKPGETIKDTSSTSYTIPSDGTLSIGTSVTFNKDCGGSLGEALTYFDKNGFTSLAAYKYIRLSTYATYSASDSTTYDSSKPAGLHHNIQQGQGQIPMTWNQMENEATAIMTNGNTTNNYASGTPVIKVNWTVTVNKDSSHNGISEQGDRYCLEDENAGNSFIINTTKLPLMERNTSIFGTESDELSLGEKAGFNSYLYRCATPMTGFTLDNPVVYFMLQATGYKITSNKELPAKYQYFSQILPQTKVSESNVYGDDNTTVLYKTLASGDPNESQCYPMFAMLKVNGGVYTSIDLYMTRIKGIVVTGGKAITFTQGTKPQQNKVSYEYLIPNSSSIYGTWGQTVYTDASATGGSNATNLTVGSSTTVSSTTGMDDSGAHVDYSNSKIKMSSVTYETYTTIGSEDGLI